MIWTSEYFCMCAVWLVNYICCVCTVCGEIFYDLSFMGMQSPWMMRRTCAIGRDNRFALCVSFTTFDGRSTMGVEISNTIHISGKKSFVIFFCVIKILLNFQCWSINMFIYGLSTADRWTLLRTRARRWYVRCTKCARLTKCASEECALEWCYTVWLTPRITHTT